MLVCCLSSHGEGGYIQAPSGMKIFFKNAYYIKNYYINVCLIFGYLSNHLVTAVFYWDAQHKSSYNFKVRNLICSGFVNF